MKKHVAWLGLVLVLASTFAAQAAAPPGRYTVSADSTTVYDTSTKLTWQRTVDANSYSQPNAVTFCTNLALSGGGWRLPKASELVTLADITLFNPAIDRTAFPSTPGLATWTASPSSSGRAFFVNFYSGAAGDDVTTSLMRVRCVR